MDTPDHPPVNDTGPTPTPHPVEALQRALEDADAAEAPDIAEAIARDLGERLDPHHSDTPSDALSDAADDVGGGRQT